MSEKLLSEYQCVLRELEMIKNRAAVIKDVTQDRLKCAKNNEEKENIFIDFKTQLHKIKKDKNIKHKYKNLIKRKEDIETEMLGKMSEEKKPKPSVKNSKQKQKQKQKTEQKQSKQHKILSESSSSESEKCVDVNVNIDVGDDLANLINKYQQNITFDESSPRKKHHKNTKHIKKHHQLECSESESSDDKNTTIIVNVPTNCNNNCNSNGGGSGSGENCNKPKKNPYMDSESCSDDVKVQKKPCPPVKRCLDDTQQVKKLYNLIKDLQCEIDK